MGRALLNSFQIIALIVWTAGWISLALIASLVTWNRQLPLVWARRHWAPGVLWLAGARLEVAPLPALDWKRPYIFVMNHQSMLDIPAAFAVLPQNLRFLAKHSLAWVPFLGWYMTFTGMVFVNRRNRQRALESLKRADERVRQGASLITYPEGTRSQDGMLQPFKRGTFVVALEAKVPIVPVAIEGSCRVLPSGSLRLRGGVIRMRVGLPIATAERQASDRDALAAEVHEEVARLITGLSQSGRPASAPDGG